MQNSVYRFIFTKGIQFMVLLLCFSYLETLTTMDKFKGQLVLFTDDFKFKDSKLCDSAWDCDIKICEIYMRTNISAVVMDVWGDCDMNKFDTNFWDLYTIQKTSIILLIVNLVCLVVHTITYITVTNNVPFVFKLLSDVITYVNWMLIVFMIITTGLPGFVFLLSFSLIFFVLIVMDMLTI